jgi:predicted oxidoreductase
MDIVVTLLSLHALFNKRIGIYNFVNEQICLLTQFINNSLSVNTIQCFILRIKNKRIILQLVLS